MNYRGNSLGDVTVIEGEFCIGLFPVVAVQLKRFVPFISRSILV